MHRAALLLAVASALAAAPNAARAQAASFSKAQILSTGKSTATVNLAECKADDALTLAWALDASPTSDQHVKIFTTADQNCGSANVIATLVDETAPDGDQSTVLHDGADVAGGSCSATESTVYVCFLLTGGGITGATASITITLDTKPPSPPDTVKATGGDTSLTVSWSYSKSANKAGDIDGYRVGYHLASSASTSDIKYTSQVSASTSTTKVTGLTNGVPYEVWVEAVDTAGNWSALSTSALGTPRASQDFWELYKADGGQQTGCSAAPGASGPAFLLLLLGAALLGRRRWRRVRGGGTRLLAGLLVAGCLLPGAARAQISPPEAPAPEGGAFFEVGLGPYRPSVDQELSGKAPYTKVFGDQKDLLFHLRFERAVYQGIGQVDLGVSAGFAQAVGKSLYADGTRSPDTTVFNWIPLTLTATYRFDYTAKRWHIPFVPFVRLGLVYQYWWILDGTGAVATDASGNAAQGGRTGFLYGGGLAFQLDALDPELSRDFRNSSGVDNTYVYFEWDQRQVDGFGSPGFNLSDGTWSAGLAFEF